MVYRAGFIYKKMDNESEGRGLSCAYHYSGNSLGFPDCLKQKVEEKVTRPE